MAEDDALVRSINRIRYRGQRFESGVLWRGGILGGEVWVSNKAKRFALDVAATTAQEWQRRNYTEAIEYIRQYRAACAAAGISLQRALDPEGVNHYGPG
ncbi:hypothetical protein [Mesorhizobium sp. M2C.T.Ca.TU.002.02.1.1]|uniref:hypothetical protein n=1 Tax=Mesorhizobium sp. M2C.T.Ca.TU.002.02.1.1 TaxID=2496788 RepID=UPI0013E34E91|nr:hypothetical protein [Mesorhizobium sp. M2C.T.Ca.TU.002.02.1.1]